MNHETSIEEMEWLSKRMGRFTASEIYKLFVSGYRPMTDEELRNESDKPSKNRKKTVKTYFGEGAHAYIRTKLAELLTLEYKPQVDFKQGEWGKEWEPVACKEFHKYLGKEGIHYGVNNPTFFEYGVYAGCSPDWEIEGHEGADIKCPYNTSEHILNLLMQSADDFKSERWEYYCQCQMSMFVRGWKLFYFVSFDPRMIEPRYRLKVLVIYPDEEWVAEFKARLQEAISTLNEMEGMLSGKEVVV